MFTIEQANRVFWGSFLLLLAITGGFVALVSLGFTQDLKIYPVRASYPLQKQPILSLVGPSFALREFNAEFEPFDLADVLEVSILPARPGTSRVESCTGIALKGQKNEKKTMSLGQKVYLGLDRNKNLHLSKGKTPFWLIPLEITEKGVVVEMQGDLSSLSKDQLWAKKVRIVPLHQSLSKPIELRNQPKYQEMAEIQWMIPDQLQKMLSPEKESFHRILIGEKTIAVKEGDLLERKAQGWESVQGSKIDQASAVIKVGKILDDAMIFEAWAESELAGVKFSIPKQAEVPLTLTSKDLLKNIRLKTRQQIQCEIDNQSISLKVGDWVLKHQGVWTVLNTPDLIEQYLTGKIHGNLLVFTEIAQEKAERTIVGYLFDTQRTQKQQLRYPILRNKPKVTPLNSIVPNSSPKVSSR